MGWEPFANTRKRQVMKRIRSGTLLLAACLLIQTGLPVTASGQTRKETAENAAKAAEKMEQDSQITAKVSSAAPSYYLTLPESIALGDLDATKDYTKTYQVGVVVEQAGNLKLKITSDKEITYKNTGDSSKQLTGYNTFGTRYFTTKGQAEGTLTVYKEDIAKVPKGTYTGTIHFYTSFVTKENEKVDGSDGQDKTDTNGTVKKDTSSTTGTHEDGSYTASVSIRKSSDIDSISMCAPLFYAKADLKVSGTSTKVTMYVIDPIPSYASEGTPLSSVKITANGTTYTASVDSGSKVSRYFDANAQFVPKAGNYYATPITFVIPTSAVEKSAEGTVKMSAYVNAVMKTTQEFYVVFSDWKDGGTKSSGEATVVDTTTTDTSITETTESAAANAKTISSAKTTSGKLTDGAYLIPASALKEKTDEASMMADYLYKNARLEISGNTSKLTVYIRHTVAGIAGGGPEWMSYNGTKAEKKENAATYNGVSYDSFTFTLSGEVPSPMPVTMYINAMKMEVKARLVFDFAKKTTADGTAANAEAEETETTEIAEMSDTGTGGKTSADAAKTLSDSLQNGYRLVTDAGVLGIVFLVLTGIAGAGAAALWWYKKRRD